VDWRVWLRLVEVQAVGCFGVRCPVMKKLLRGVILFVQRVPYFIMFAVVRR
jgi:hypothetical protein